MATSGTCLAVIGLESSFLGNRPKELWLYQDRMILKYKKEEKEFLFADVWSLKTGDMFVPNPSAYSFEMFDKQNQKLAAFKISYQNRQEALKVLECHKIYRLGEHFPMDLMESEYILDDHFTWEKGTLVYRTGKTVGSFQLSEIEGFIEKNGTFFFTLAGRKNKLVVGILYAPNCLMTIDICKAIAAAAGKL